MNVEEILKLRNIFSVWVTICIGVYLVVLPRNNEQALDLAFLGRVIWFCIYFYTNEQAPKNSITSLMSSCYNFQKTAWAFNTNEGKFSGNVFIKVNFVLFTGI